MPINKIVPAYKEKFGRVFSVSNFGHPKLIRALEALDELIYVSIECCTVGNFLLLWLLCCVCDEPHTNNVNLGGICTYVLTQVRPAR